MASSCSPPRANTACTGEWLGDLDDATIDGLAEAHREASSPLSAIVLAQMGGAVAEVPEGETAFAFRHAAHALEVIPSWTASEDPAPHLRWMREVRAAVSSSSLGAGYVNFLGDEGPERVQTATDLRSTGTCRRSSRRSTHPIAFASTRTSRRPPPAPWNSSRARAS